jgi:hypothetical protein
VLDECTLKIRDARAVLCFDQGRLHVTNRRGDAGVSEVSLDEVDRFLTEIKKKSDELTLLLQQYEKQAARAANSQAAALEFKINVTKDGAPAKRKSPNVIVDRFKKVVIPNITQLRNNFALVDDLYEKLDILRTLESTVSMHFQSKAGSGKTLDGIRRLTKQVETKIRDALKFLNRIASKHAPEPFVDFVQKTVDRVSDSLSFDSYEAALYVRETDSKTFEFTHYIRLLGLVDDEDKAYPEMYLVFTCVLTPTGKTEVQASYHVTVLSEFAVPGRFDTGTAVDSVQAAVLVIGSLLDMENFSNALGTLPIDLDKKIDKNTFTVGKSVSQLEVDERSISFILAASVKSQSAVQAVTQQLYLEVKALLYRVKAKLKVRITKELGRYRVTFTLSNLAGPNQVSVHDLDFLRDKLGVDDDKLRKIVRVINGG